MGAFISEEEAKEAINNLYPTGFLQQLGEARGNEVKLGEDVCVLGNYSRTKITVNVISLCGQGEDESVEPGHTTIGTYQIAAYADGSVCLHYIGLHPSHQNERIHLVSAGPSKGYQRQDGWSRDVIFPGIA